MKTQRKSKATPRQNRASAERKSAAKAPSRPQEYEAEKHLRSFCNATSHELSNVIGALVGELDFGLSNTDNSIRDNAMSIALKAAERALTLARNLRYFAVHARLDVRPTDVSQLILDSIELVEKELERQKIQLTVFVEAATYAEVDSGAVQQIVMNLLQNARAALPRGGKVTLTLRQIPDALELCVMDTGVGIPETQIDHVFEPYFAAQGYAQDKARGGEAEGLGLAVTKALVDAHGGEITVESRPGHGTTFSVYIPCDTSRPKPGPYPEKRKFRRVRLRLPVELLIRGQSPFPTELTMLSNAGCFIRTPDLNLKLPDVNGNVRLRIFCYPDQVIEIPKARVASVCRIGGNEGMGLEFMELDSRGKKVLSAIVKSHSS